MIIVYLVNQVKIKFIDRLQIYFICFNNQNLKYL